MGKKCPVDYNDQKIPTKVPMSGVYDEKNVLLSTKFNNINNELAKSNHYINVINRNNYLQSEQERLSNLCDHTYTDIYNEKFNFVTQKRKELATAVVNRNVPLWTDTKSFREIADAIRKIENGNIYINNNLTHGFHVNIGKSTFTSRDMISSLKNVNATSNESWYLQDGALVYHNGSIYSIGVRPASESVEKATRFYVYDVTSNKWMRLDDFPVAFSSTCAASFGGFIHGIQKGKHYIFNGSSWVTDTYKLPNYDLFESDSPNVNHIALVSFKDYLYLFDTTPTGTSKNVFKFSVDSNGYITNASFPSGCPIKVIWGKSVVVAGTNYIHVFKENMHYVTANGSSWVRKADVPINVAIFSVGCAMGTKILLITSKYFTTKFDDMVVLSYNEVNDKWTVLGDLPYNITGGSAVYHANLKKVYLGGGNSASSTSNLFTSMDACLGDETYHLLSITSDV